MRIGNSSSTDVLMLALMAQMMALKRLTECFRCDYCTTPDQIGIIGIQTADKTLKGEKSGSHYSC